MFALSKTLAGSGVLKVPAQRVLIRISDLAYSMAADLVSPITPSFAAEYREAHVYAVQRAALTLFHEEHHWDDSYGVMDELGNQKSGMSMPPSLVSRAPSPIG